MTRAERIQAFELRLDGKTWEAIGQALGYDGSSVCRDLRLCISAPRRPPQIIYPALLSLCVQQFDGSILQMSRALGLSDSALRKCLFGKSRPTARVIDAIRNQFGLTYEAAFSKGETA